MWRMTPTKLALAGTAMLALLIMFATRPGPAPTAEEDQSQVNSARTLALAQMPFDHPSWEPNEATKKKALMRAYQLNGNNMVGDHMIDVSKEDLTERVTADQPAHAEAEIVDPKSRNALDAQVEDQDWDARRRFMNRTFRATRTQLASSRAETKSNDVCAKHGLHKVVYRGSWRCRK